jgi:hypothetical protein
VALSTLPPNCAAPGSLPYSGLTPGGFISVSFTVLCTEPVGPVGTLTGTVTVGDRPASSSDSVTVTAWPSGGLGIAVLVDSTGHYRVPNVPVGNGAGIVAVTKWNRPTSQGRPVLCTTPAVAYTGLTAASALVIPPLALSCRLI